MVPKIRSGCHANHSRVRNLDGGHKRIVKDANQPLVTRSLMWLTTDIKLTKWLCGKIAINGMITMRSPPFLFPDQFGPPPSRNRMSLQNINVLYGVTTTEAHLSLIKSHISYPPDCPPPPNPRTRKASKRFWTPSERLESGPTPSDPVWR